MGQKHFFPYYNGGGDWWLQIEERDCRKTHLVGCDYKLRTSAPLPSYTECANMREHENKMTSEVRKVLAMFKQIGINSSLQYRVTQTG